MVKVQFLVPLKDNDGRTFKPSVWRWLQDQLVQRFGGWSQDGTLQGAWKDESGRIYHDKNKRFSVAVDKAREPELLAFLASEVKPHFKQLSLYVEEPETQVQFV